eukprot:1426514-Rhodomonas_salina.2
MGTVLKWGKSGNESLPTQVQASLGSFGEPATDSRSVPKLTGPEENVSEMTRLEADVPCTSRVCSWKRGRGT